MTKEAVIRKIIVLFVLILFSIPVTQVWALQFVNKNRLPWISDVDINRESLPLFTLTRSKNRNVVHYNLYMDQSEVKVITPLAIYWEMVEKNGRIEDLNEIEKKKIYGPQFAKKESGQIIFAIAALPDFLIVVENKPCGPITRWQAFLQHDGHEVVLDSVFVQLQNDDLIPKVDFVDVTGKNCLDAQEVKFRIVDNSKPHV